MTLVRIDFMASVIRPSTVRKKLPALMRPAVAIGTKVMLVSGSLAGFAGEVVRVEKHQLCLVAIPNASSGLLVRVPHQRFKSVMTPTKP